MLNKEDIDWNSLEFDGYNMADYPDFVDVMLISANFKDGRELTEDELYELEEQYYDDVQQAKYENFDIGSCIDDAIAIYEGDRY